MQDQTLNDNLSENIDKCIRTLSKKFWKWPYNFFTESDAHSYLYYSFFRYGSRHLKVTHPSKDGKQTVLIHREYPTFFKYRQKDLSKRYSLHESEGTRGHYDMIVLNPLFVKDHAIETVISKDNKISQTIKYGDHHLLAAIEFKLLHKPLGPNMLDEIRKDFIKLDWALETGQARHAYMLIFNRYGEEKRFKERLEGLKVEHHTVKLIYQESYYKNGRHRTFITSSLSQIPTVLNLV